MAAVCEEKKRRPKFSAEELYILLNEAKKRQKVIEGPLTPSLTLKKKRAAWYDITENINEVTQVTRTVSEVRNKFIDFKSVTKKKMARRIQEQNKTGGGENHQPELTPPEALMASMLHPVMTEGIGQLLEGEMLSDPEDDLHGELPDSQPEDSRKQPLIQETCRPSSPVTLNVAELGELLAVPDPKNEDLPCTDRSESNASPIAKSRESSHSSHCSTKYSAMPEMLELQKNMPHDIRAIKLSLQNIEKHMSVVGDALTAIAQSIQNQNGQTCE